MTEAEWLNGTDPTPLLEHVRHEASERKRLLFCLACCRRVEQHVPNWPAAAWVGVLEQLADGRATPAVVPERVSSEWSPEPYTLQFGPTLFDMADAVLEAALAPCRGNGQESAADSLRIATGPMAVVAHMNWLFRLLGVERHDPPGTLIPDLHDIFGNPFRTVTVDPRWQTETVVALATGIYADRAFDRMPILADALEEAGGDHADILTHCRGPGPHVRGCWVVDLVLGKG